MDPKTCLHSPHSSLLRHRNHFHSLNPNCCQNRHSHHVLPKHHHNLLRNYFHSLNPNCCQNRHSHLVLPKHHHNLLHNYFHIHRHIHHHHRLHNYRFLLLNSFLLWVQLF